MIRKKDRKKRRISTVPYRKRYCRFCKERDKEIDYKDIRLVERFVGDRLKIVPRRASGLCAKHQRRVSEAIKRARFLAIIDYVKR
ncbi:MAG: 30S ribosomal protein S18 [Candidatus Gygaella obscura]|nr:30S ribosomal protein S18 [Candidatus Gygaella obscura]